MHTATDIVIRAPLAEIFDTVSDLERWPELLPHYRWVEVVSREGDRSVVRMAATRDGIPISWESEFIVDRKTPRMHFRHLKAWTKGMVVSWEFEVLPDGACRVEIVHDLRFRIPALGPVFEPLIGRFFVENIARKTLRTFRQLLESRAGRNG